MLLYTWNEYYWCDSRFQCPKPVLAAIHNACVGGGVDLVTATDFRYCTQDSFIQVKVFFYYFFFGGGGL